MAGGCNGARSLENLLEVKAMTARVKVPIVPASFFGFVLGLAGLANAWRAAHQVWKRQHWWAKR